MTTPMPKDNEVDEKAVLWRAPHGNDKWMYFDHEPTHLKSYEPLYSAATVAELRGELDRWKSRYDDAMRARADEQKRADDAEHRAGYLKGLLSDTAGNLRRLANDEFAECDQVRLEHVVNRIEHHLTGAPA